LKGLIYLIVVANGRKRMILQLLFFFWAVEVSQALVVPSSSRFLRKDPRSNVVRLQATLPAEGAPDLTDSTLFQAPDMEAFAAGYKTVFEEVPCRACSPSVGKIPDDLMGTYYRSGPAMFSAGSIVPPKTSIVQPKQPPVPDGQDPDRMVQHPFEGDGAILGVTFSGDGQATTRFRYIRTIAFTTERKKGQRVYKGMDSTREMGPSAAEGLGNDLPLPLFRHHLQPGLNKNRRNTSNTRATYWGKRLLTLWEGGQPYKLDSIACSTEGKSQLGSAIMRETDPFGGKMVYDSKLNRALFYGLEQDPKRTEVALYEFDDNFRLVENGRTFTDLPGFALLNDFCATENYAVFVQPDIAANGMQYLVGKEPGKNLNVEKGAATVHLVPRTGSSRQQASFTIPFDGSVEANLQFINAYEEGDAIFFDSIRSDGSKAGSKMPKWPWASTLDDYRAAASKKSLWRYSVDTKSGSVSKRLLLDSHCFFGVVNPAVSAQRHCYIYMNVGSMGNKVAPPQGIAKLNVETGQSQVWMPESYEFCGEPMYAPKKGQDGEEDSGYIVSVLFNGQKQESELVILQATDIAAGPITRIPLGVAVPHGLFGCFAATEEATWSMDTIDRRSKLTDKIESRGNIWNEVKSDFSGLGLRFDDMEEYFGDFFG